MKAITLKEFMNKLGYYPHNHNKNKTSRAFARLVGLNDPDISKAYNGKILEDGYRWNKLVNFVASYGYQLISANPIDYMESNVRKKNKKQEEYIKHLEIYIQLLESQLEDVREIVRISTRISENKNNIKELHLKCKQ